MMQHSDQSTCAVSSSVSVIWARQFGESGLFLTPSISPEIGRTNYEYVVWYKSVDFGAGKQHFDQSTCAVSHYVSVYQRVLAHQIVESR